jgi:hypothetical protein
VQEKGPEAIDHGNRVEDEARVDSGPKLSDGGGAQSELVEDLGLGVIGEDDLKAGAQIHDRIVLIGRGAEAPRRHLQVWVLGEDAQRLADFP